MKDPMVVSAQNWLNENFGMNLEVTGHTGTIVMEALITALQIDLGMTSTTGYFGNETANLYASHQISVGSFDPADNSSHLVTILQYGLFCKGYNPGFNLGSFDSSTLAAVKKVQIDAGLIGDQISEVLTPRVFKAILSSDALVLVRGGDPIIRGIQRALNQKYVNYIGIMPCDGLYGAGLAKSLIYGLQAEGGMAIGTANGNFGPGTQTIATNHPQSSANYSANFVLIAKYALYCNGVRRNAKNEFDTSVNSAFTGIYDDVMTKAVTDFQNFTAIMEVSGNIGIKEWMSLLVSTGYPKRNVLACDTSTQITDFKAQKIVANDFSIIGRYLTGSTSGGPKNLTRAELEILFKRGLRVFAIYQDEKAYYAANPSEYTTVNYYDYEQGLNDAQKACDAAIALGIPYDEYIFFSVDYDFNDAQVTSKIIPHFKGINDYMRMHGFKYKIGIYGPRNACTRVSNVSLAELSFVSDMSTGFSGNLGNRLPENWVFDQIREYTQGATDGSFNVDCVAASGKYTGFNSIFAENVVQPELTSDEIALRFFKSVTNVLGITVEEELFLGDKITIPYGAFNVEIESKVGTNVSMDSANELTKVTIENGEYKKSSWTISEDIVAGVSEELNAEITADGKFKLGDVIKWKVKDGYIKLGINITADGKIELTYIVHKEASVIEGLKKFAEIGIKITSNSTLPKKDLDAYYAYQACIDLTQVIDYLTDEDWVEILIIALIVIILALISENLLDGFSLAGIAGFSEAGTVGTVKIIDFTEAAEKIAPLVSQGVKYLIS